VTGHSQLSRLGAGLAVTVPISIYLLMVWTLHAPYKRPGMVRNIAVPLAVVSILASSKTGEPILISGLVLALLVAVSVTTSTGEVFESAQDS
jgi:hypothetical protein